MMPVRLVQGSRQVALCRPMRHLAADTIAGNRVVSIGACRCRLPIELPGSGVPRCFQMAGSNSECGRRDGHPTVDTTDSVARDEPARPGPLFPRRPASPEGRGYRRRARLRGPAHRHADHVPSHRHRDAAGRRARRKRGGSRWAAAPLRASRRSCWLQAASGHVAPHGGAARRHEQRDGVAGEHQPGGRG